MKKNSKQIKNVFVLSYFRATVQSIDFFLVQDVGNSIWLVCNKEHAVAYRLMLACMVAVILHTVTEWRMQPHGRFDSPFNCHPS